MTNQDTSFFRIDHENEFSVICTKRHSDIQYFLTNIYTYPHQILRRCYLALTNPIVYDVVNLAFRDRMTINRKQFKEFRESFVEKKGRNIRAVVEIDFDKEIFSWVSEGEFCSCPIDDAIEVSEEAFKKARQNNRIDQIFREQIVPHLIVDTK